MKLLKTKMALLLATSCLMVPSVMSAATETVDAPTYTYMNGSIYTLVQDTYVPGRYLINEDTVAVYIPGGIGIIAVDKDTVLPWGSKYLD
ncbi:hypothetical protein ASG89_14520 [Paenibacillus sp. Soil766]|uniref:hypothetical protein n=1 Tax=Paenibacillus sp. Soil766 TaxID=1736404 RepID=UPI00071009EF|nr:hypothetical protein [Paenibacillus sp. Soil766]KRE82468.1 hypothetical protein ASG89_14520 [Paenibacillus sp. Soil766]